MKYLLLLLGLFFSSEGDRTFVLKEEIPLDSSMSFVISSDVPVNTKMLNAKTWVAKTFGDYKSVLQYEDNNNHRIIIKGTVTVTTSVSGDATGKYTASFTSTYDFKDDRFRIKYENIKIEYTVSYHGVDLNLPVELGDFFTTSKTERYLADKKAELEVLKERSSEKLSLKEREKLNGKIADIEKTISEQEVFLAGEAIERAEQHRNDFQVTFWGLIATAISEINADDDF